MKEPKSHHQCSMRAVVGALETLLPEMKHEKEPPKDDVVCADYCLLPLGAELP